MTTLKSHNFKIRYKGGIAEDHRLSLYDGTASIHGIAQALQISTHAYLNDEIVTRATALNGANFLLRPARQGSFLFDIIMQVEKYPATSSAVAAISAPVIYDFMKVVFKRATGDVNAEPETNHIERLIENREPFFDELSETLEGSLQRAHRPIGSDINNISVERARGPLFSFDIETQDWVNTNEEDSEDEIFTGNVTRYNSISRNGRAYIEQLNRVIPFKPQKNFPVANLGNITWSLHGSNTDLSNLVEFKGHRIKSANGKTKRLIIHDCTPLNLEP